ncbi:hypothetical protein ES705_02081 [subsurface metagenome]
MKEMIGYCGYNCHLCAARSDDPVIRQKMVDGWKKILGHENYTAENVRCDGCKSNGRIADKECKARPCAKEKGIEHCAYCDEFPCDKIKYLISSREGMLIWLFPKTSSITEEEYNLCLRQFESMPNLLRILASAGKIPSWTVKSSKQSKK